MQDCTSTAYITNKINLKSVKKASPDFSLSPPDAMVCSGLDTSESTLFFGSLCTRFKFFDGVLFFLTLENKVQSILQCLNENET
jgi:hypothetical protein